MRNCSCKILVLLKWKVFNVSLELELGKLSRHETGFIKVEILPSQGPRGASRQLVIKSEATVLIQLLCVLHWTLFLEQWCSLYGSPDCESDSNIKIQKELLASKHFKHPLILFPSLYWRTKFINPSRLDRNTFGSIIGIFVLLWHTGPCA
jgi:hypothetical protein